MFEKLVESKNGSGKGKTRNRITAMCAAIVLTVFAGAMVTSLFNSALAMADEFNELSRLATPAIPTTEPEPEVKSATSATAEQVRNDLPTRKQIVQRAEDTPAAAPDIVSTVPSTLKTRPLGAFKLSDRDYDPPRSGMGSRGTEGGTGFLVDDTGKGPDVREPEKTTVPEPPKLEPKPEKPEYIGVVNGKAEFLDMPAYPATARQMGIRGVVKVQVLIDEEGNVESAKAIDGPALLRSSSTSAARNSRFTPTLLNKKKVKVRGVILYNFQ